MNKRVLFRVDANFKIGGGHLYRCLILAKEFTKRKINVTFYSNLEGDFKKWIENYQIINDIDNKHFDIIIFDGYNFDYQYINSFNKNRLTKIIVIDDFADKEKYNSDLIINPNFYDETPLYYGIDKSKVITGFESIIINDEVLNIKNQTKNEINNVLVTFGNSDPDDLTSQVINSNIEKFLFTFNFVIGDLYRNEKSIHISKKNVLLYPSNSLFELYKYTDFAIIAGGNTLWELLYLNIPVISFSRNLFQKKILKSLANKGLIMYCENITDLFQIFTDLKFIEKIKKIKEQSKNIIDGKGKERIINKIINL